VSALKLLFVFGTRPEAIKLCPVVKYMKSQRGLEVKVCVTAQHREMLDIVLAIFDVKPDYDLGAMRPGQTLFQSTSRILADLEPVLQAEKPDVVLVQGDTTTTFCGAMAGFYANVAVGHIEAGLRTGDIRQPFPEEMNRVLVSKLAAFHFPATEWAAENLRAEGIRENTIAITGNTGIDAVLQISDLLEKGELNSKRDWSSLDPSKKLVLLTAHRRESFGEGFERICAAVSELAKRDDVQIVYPVHPNPNVTGPVYKHLADKKNILLIEPLDYVSFVDLMRRSYILLTDSGGIQEEGPSLGKPILVLRDKTERPEAVKAGTVSLVGSDSRKIVDTAGWLLDDEAEYQRRARIHNPYGDGHASELITESLKAGFGQTS
jgi:UDP-N-acetylglucosamine 2-epimerase (non-hydrolysing)